MSDMTLKQAQEEVREFIYAQGRDWSQIDNHFYLFTHLSEEMGELARHMINADFEIYDREESVRKTREGIARENAVSRIEDDLGDLLYHLLKLAIAYNIDLSEAFEKAFSNVQKKVWIGLSRTVCGFKSHPQLQYWIPLLWIHLRPSVACREERAKETTSREDFSGLQNLASRKLSGIQQTLLLRF